MFIGSVLQNKTISNEMVAYVTGQDIVNVRILDPQDENRDEDS